MPLRFVLMVPFVLQIFAAVGLVGYFSLRNGQQAVNELALALMSKGNNLVEQHLDYYLATPSQINQLNVDAVQLGLLDLQDFQRIGQYFWKQMHLFNVGYINFANEKGEFIGVERLNNGQLLINETLSKSLDKLYIYQTDDRGNRTNWTVKKDADPIQKEDWYADAAKAGKPVWSRIYQWQDKPEVLSISSSYPVYDQRNKLIGVLGVDLILTQLNDFLKKLKVSPSGEIFILERHGFLVASSGTTEPFTVVDRHAQRIQAVNSPDNLTRLTTQYLLKHFGSFDAIVTNQQLSFKAAGVRQYVKVTPWREQLGLDWLVVVVVPESDFMAQINANTKATILLCLAALLLATLLGVTTSSWISRPIRRLSEASVAIANGDLNQDMEVNTIQELEVLSQSFNQMALQLKESFKQLETRVEERTSELYIAKETAEAANYAKSEFLANVIHELRTPLNAILGFTQVMLGDNSLIPQQQENLEIMHRSGKHLLSLINNVLDLSKIEANRVVVNANAFDLACLLSTVEEMFKLVARAKGIQLVIDSTQELPQYVSTDESKLRQILINLLGNAIKFTDVGSVVLRVRVGQEKFEAGYFLHFEVEDTGTGIASEELDRIFEPFVQTASGLKSQQGTGLGLSISRKFVQLMGGEITVTSSLKVGTIFKFYIQVQPASSADILTEKQVRRVISLAPGQPQYRVLVVDDSWERRLFKLLAAVGFEVRSASNNHEAIALWSSWKPQLIWINMSMPAPNSYETIKQIKSQLEQKQTTAIVALIACVAQEREAVLEAGCDDFVTQPFQEEAILDKMIEHLGVRYVYELHQEKESMKEEQTTQADNPQPVPPEELCHIFLTVMPTKWLLQLHQAACQLDATLMEQLLEQIPPSQQTLKQSLQQKIHDFDFDQIINLIQQAVL